MSQANRRDPPSSAGIMSSTSVIGNFPVARDDDDDDDEEVNADDDGYNGNYSAGFDVDGDDDLEQPAKPVVTNDSTMDVSHNTEPTASSDHSNMNTMATAAPPGTAVATSASRGHGNSNTSSTNGTINHLRQSVGNVFGVVEASNEVANSESRGHLLWNSAVLAVTAAGTINGLLKRPQSNNNGIDSPGGTSPTERDADEEDGPVTSGNQGVATPTMSTPHARRSVWVWIMVGVVVVAAIIGISVGVGNSKSKTKSINYEDPDLMEICEFLGIYDVNVCLSETNVDTGLISSGTLPNGIGLLTQLTSLTIYGTPDEFLPAQLTGSIPSSIGNLFRLQNLNFNKNAFVGTIPESVGRLSSLTTLDLSSNADLNLNGTFPSWIGDKLTRLVHLDLGDTSFKGTVPASLGNLVGLTSLSLYYTFLGGPIPTEIAKLIQLEHFDFSRNRFTGTIPSWIGQLSQLEYLDLDDNMFTGPIPSELGNLVQLTSLYIDTNIGVNGPIPSEIGNLSNLLTLSLSNNALTGTIPSSLGNLIQLESLTLNNNILNGEIPSSMGNLSNLDVLYLYGNPSLSGTVPYDVCGLDRDFFVEGAGIRVDCTGGSLVCGSGCVCQDGNGDDCPINF